MAQRGFLTVFKPVQKIAHGTGVKDRGPGPVERAREGLTSFAKRTCEIGQGTGTHLAKRRFVLDHLPLTGGAELPFFLGWGKQDAATYAQRGKDQIPEAR